MRKANVDRIAHRHQSGVVSGVRMSCDGRRGDRICQTMRIGYHQLQAQFQGIAMHSNLSASLDRADELMTELSAEYERSMRDKVVSARAVQITHDVCEKLRGVLDRTARRYWDIHVAPDISEQDRSRACIYFPIASNQDRLDAILGRWCWKSVRSQHQPVYDYLSALQPFANANNQWLSTLNDLAVQGKHIDLVPQKKFDERRITVTRQGGPSVSWAPSGVTFGLGVSIMGAPVDPRTQRIMPIEGITERIETWVSFIIEGHNVNALAFCKESCKETRRIMTEMSLQFEL